VNGLCYTAFLLIYLWMWLRDPIPGAGQIVIAFAWTAVFSWVSYLKKSAVASILACLGMSASIAGMNLYRWPHSDEVVVLPQFLWSLLIICGNTPLNFLVKTALALLALATALVVAVYSPLLNVSDALPVLLGATAVHILFHYYAMIKAGSKKELISAHGASLVLAGTFAYHMSHEILSILSKPGYATEGGYSILKAGFFASVGLAAAGAFRREIDVKESLEVQVEERTREIVKQAERLHMVGLALEESETAIAITDSDQRVVWFNPALKRLVERKESQLQNQPILEVLRPSHVDSSKLLICFNEKATLHEEITLCGSEILAEVSPFSEVEGADSTARFLVVLKDITAQRARERAEQAAEQEAALAKAMSESIEVLSHDLRTPLQGILGMTSMMLDDPLVPIDTKESLSMVLASSRLLLTLINNLLDVRKCDADRMDAFQIVSVPLAETLENACDFCKPIATLTRVKIELSLDEARGATVQSDALRLQQVVINLTSNAIKYTAVGSIVRIRAQIATLERVEAAIDQALTSGPHQSAWDTRVKRLVNVVVISVSDEGRGVSSDAAGRLFGRFSQLQNHNEANKIGESTVGQPSGSGLGLNLCLKFVQRMKGNIWVINNDDGPGSTFAFYLPLTSGSLARAYGSESPRRQALADSSFHGGSDDLEELFTGAYRVLVVDDSVINRKVVGRMLKRVGIETVGTADSGEKALELLEEVDYNLVITDIHMPGMSGMELSEAIREGNFLSRPVVVGLTADASDSREAEYAESGMVHLLHKPVTKSQMQDFFENIAPQLSPATI